MFTMYFFIFQVKIGKNVTYVRSFIVAVRLNDSERFSAAVSRLNKESLVTARVANPSTHLRQEAEVMPAPGVAVVEVDATPVHEVSLGRPTRCGWPQRVHQHPGGHVRTLSGRVRGAPDVDAERRAHDVVLDDVRLEPESASLLTICR